MPAVGIVKGRILGFFSQLGEGIPVAVRMLFCFGREYQVYKIASDLAKKKLLIRVASGVYMLPNPDGALPSAAEIAFAKAQGFGKDIYELDEEIKANTADLKLMSCNPIALFATSGSSSSFRCRAGTIVFYKMANRKIELLKKKIGRAFVSFWKLMTHHKKEMDEAFKKSQISPRDQKFTPNLLELLPLWLKTDLRESYSEMPWELSITEGVSRIKGRNPASQNENVLSYVLLPP